MTPLTQNLVKILFRFHSTLFDREMVETLWAIAVDEKKGWYQLDNLPFHVPSIAFEDIVFAEFDQKEQMLTYRETIKFSGNSSIHVILLDKLQEINSVRDLFHLLGCSSEKLNEGYFSINIPEQVKYSIV